MKKKWLFLDIDGVLIHEEWYLSGIPSTMNTMESNFDPKCVERVNRIINETGCELVVSSSWRLGVDLECIFKRVGLPDNFHRTPKLWKERGIEIDEFLKSVGEDEIGKNYAILDDDTDFNIWQKKHNLFRTAASKLDEPYKRNEGTGLTDKLTDEIIKFLNNEKSKKRNTRNL